MALTTFLAVESVLLESAGISKDLLTQTYGHYITNIEDNLSNIASLKYYFENLIIFTGAYVSHQSAENCTKWTAAAKSCEMLLEQMHR